MSVDRRLNKLEHQLGLSHKQPRLIMIVTGYGTLAIDDDECVRILDEAGFLPTSGIASVYLIDIPRGLNAKETEKFLRDNGATICGSRLARSPDGVGSA